MKKYSPAACLLLAGCFSPGPDIPSATTGTTSTSAMSTSETSTSTMSATMTTSASELATSSSTGAPSDTEGQQTTVDSTSADPSTCGDGMLDPEEECDDGATADEDGCSAVCTKELRRVFVTSAVFTGDLGGRAGADAKCQAAAKSASAPGTFRAWLSTSNASPADDFVKSAVPYVRLDDVQVAADWQDLVDGALEAPIIVSELGGPPAASTHVCIPQDAWGAWTSTNEKGLPSMKGTCSNWSTTNGDSTLGRVGDASLAWSFFCVTPCSSKASLYCVEQ